MQDNQVRYPLADSERRRRCWTKFAGPMIWVVAGAALGLSAAKGYHELQQYRAVSVELARVPENLRQNYSEIRYWGEDSPFRILSCVCSPDGSEARRTKILIVYVGDTQMVHLCSRLGRESADLNEIEVHHGRRLVLLAAGENAAKLPSVVVLKEAGPGGSEEPYVELTRDNADKWAMVRHGRSSGDSLPN